MGNAGIQETIAGLQGPEEFWGAEGVLLGHEEADIKGYDNFTTLAAALTANNIDLTGADYTILAPSDSAIAAHVAAGGDELTTDQTTLQGGTLTSYRKFRKNWLDNAIVGLKSEGPSKSSNWPADFEADNGIIHGIDSVLIPGAYTG